MRIKQRPEDFSVRESFRFDPSPRGRFFVYLMDKQKLSTFEAVERIRLRFGLRPGAISFCGLKDKQGRTEQLIAVDSKDVSLQEPDLRLKFLGRADQKLSAANTTSNRFSVTVRALTQGDLASLNLSVPEVQRLGVIDYFDSQRFGSLKHGQGFIAKDLIRGDFEAALKNHMAKPSPLDYSEDAQVKAFWQKNWGKWTARPPFASGRKYDRILYVLKQSPHDFPRAFMQIDADYRALLLFAYQSYLWNEGARRLLQLLLPKESLFPIPYQAGTLLFHRDGPPDVLAFLRKASFPLLSPSTTFDDPRVKEAAEWALGREKIHLSDLSVPGAERKLWFKHEERPLLVRPHKLVVGRVLPDELNPPCSKVNVAFTLPPGAYATLVIKRLFHFAYAKGTKKRPAAPTSISKPLKKEAESRSRPRPRPSSRPRSRTERNGRERRP